MYTVNYLREDGTSYARSFDTRVQAVEDAMLKVIWNRDVAKANVWAGTNNAPLGPIEYEFVVHISNEQPEE
jgi:hypothetical protein